MQLANIAVYPADSTDFSHQGYGILSDVLSAVVTEATADNNNVSQELEVTYPIGGTNVEYIKNTNMIRASTGTGADDYMIFEIYDYDENTDGTLSVHAQALPYRILKIPFDNGGIFDKFATVQLAINGGLSHVTGFPNWFHITSDVDVKQDFRKDQISNLGGMLDLILDRTECYVEYGWNYIKILKNRGKQITDVVLRDDSNVSGVQVVADYSNIINKIVPLLRARNAAGEYTDEPDYLGKIVTSKNPFKYIKYWSGMAAKFDGQEVADNYFVKEGVDQPKITATVNPLIIDDNLAAVKLFDSMQVYASKINYTATLKVVSRTFDALTCEVTDFKLGGKKKTLIDNNSTLSNIEDKINQANDTAQYAITSSNGKNTNYYSEDEPKNPVEGDTWFHTDDKGRPIIDQYIDGKWVQIVGHEKEDEVDKAIYQAQKDTEEAVKNANDAVAKADAANKAANDAVAKAGFANNTATQAKSDAATAGQQAKDALTSAGTAIIDAKKALTDSGSAMADSAQARKDSATAIKDAADSLTSAKDAINKVGNLTTSVTSQFTTVNNELKSKVNQTDYDKLKGTVTTQQTEINQNASGIKLKADKSYADTINNSVVKNTSGIGLLNDQIALTVSKTELNNTLSSYATQTWTQSQIKSTADQINLSVSRVQNNLDNMELGSVNLIIRKDELVNRMIGPTGAIDPFAESSVTKNIISVEPGKYLTLSRYDSVADNNFRFAFYDSAGAMILRSFDPADTPKVLTVPANAATLRVSYPTGARVKLERGQKGTEYSAAPEDLVTDIEFAELAVKVDGITATVANKADKTQITQLSNQISLKADTTALNTLKGTVDKQGSEITLNTNSIKLKADQSSVNTLKGTVDKQGSAIDVNTKAIALKASQSTVDTITGRVSTAEGKITVQAGQIAQTVSKTELTTKLNGYATQTWAQSQIKSTADQINLSVTKVQTNLDNMELGSVNLIVRKDELKDRMIGSTGEVEPFSGSSLTKAVVSVTPGNALTMTRYNSVADNNFRFAFYDASGAVVKRGYSDSWSHTEEVPPKSVTFRISYGTNLTVKLERGQKGTEYSAAPEDLASEAQFSQLQVTVNGIQGTVQNKADKSQVTQLTNQITSVVSDVASINDGGRNYFSNSTFNDPDMSIWSPMPYPDLNLKIIRSGFAGFMNKAAIHIVGTTSHDFNGISQTTNLPGSAGEFAFISFLAATTASGVNTLLHVGCNFMQGTTSVGDSSVNVDLSKLSRRERIKVSIKGPNTWWDHVIVGISPLANKAIDVWLTELKAEVYKFTAWTPAIEDSISKSQITQMKDLINLRVQKGDVINQINISPESILIAGQKVHITGTTTIDNAVIKDAMIADIKADKITAGTLNAANVNLVNLNANNITTGTIKGANLSMNLNTGEVVFQHGRIHSASNNVDVNIDQGYLSVANGNTRVLLKNGSIQFVQPTIFDERTNPYLSISNGGSGLAFSGARIVGRDYVVMANNANSSNIFDSPLGGAESFAGISAGYDGTRWHPTKIGGADRGVLVSSGTPMSNAVTWVGSPPSIMVGYDSRGNMRGNRVHITGDYVHLHGVYQRSDGRSPNMVINSDGAVTRSTSASKYKADIIRTNQTSYGDKLLGLPTATWMDIAETKRYQDNPTTQPKPTRNFGMIAEDLADAGLEMLVVRGADGELEGINYDRIGPALIPVIAKLKNEVETLKQQLEEKQHDKNTNF